MQQNAPAPRIVLLGSGSQIQGLSWESTSQLRIGRAQTMEIVIQDASISRQHAEILFDGRGWVVRDLGSSAGTFLNGVRLDQKPRKLQLQDTLHCGQIAFTVSLLEEMRPAAAPLARAEKATIKTTGQFVRVQASTQRSWEQGLQDLAQEPQQLAQGKHFLTLVRAGYHLCRIGSLKELVQSILDDTVAVFQARSGAVLLREAKTGALVPRAFSSFGHKSPAAAGYSTTLAQRCFTLKESMLCSDAGGHGLAELKTGDGRMASILCAFLRSPRQPLGVIHLDRSPDQEPFTKDHLHLADALAASISVGIECAELVEQYREPFLDKVTAFVRRAIQLRDPHTGRHIEKVREYALLLAEELKLSAEECRTLEVGAWLHDLGKIALEDAILHKPDKLTLPERERVEEQLLKGAELAEIIPDFAPVLPIIRSHHERWDGHGYPEGLAGEKIPRLARIIAIADAFDTMTSDQPYRPAMAVEAALAELEAGAGNQFDPVLVQAFLSARPRLDALLASGLDSDTACPSSVPAETCLSTAS